MFGPNASWLVILGSAPGSATVFGVSPFFIWRRGVEVVAMVLVRRFEKRNVGSGFGFVVKNGGMLQPFYAKKFKRPDFQTRMAVGWRGAAEVA